MKFVTYLDTNGKPRPGVMKEDKVADLSSLGFEDVLSIIRAGKAGIEKAAAAPATIENAKLAAPLANPPRIFGIGLNYHDHAIESNMAIPKTPVVFMKLACGIIGPGQAIELPSISTQPDYEAEFAIVIGKGGRNITDNWRDHIFGYTILNDVSARDVQLATSQWTLGKSFPTFAPMGPAIVTADEIADPHALDVKLEIDGELLQNSNTRELIFKAPELLRYISSITPLEPGDIISTGTPAGVGLGRTPQRWLKPGETVAIEIAGLGRLVNPVVAGV
ncbi:fumarylacetoacetate hydrolase family protein [Acidipila rosea]|uniref:2-keto-4-pentenoate hydratase/2-oxohepta-3-ene-1,7-dioic acid hydratase in catechol pathway n=1 Tax=Acidipila rosea TaxID=768535 RepID=A0A4R1L7H9_9BACT|nr:fumarylacetoacetate hydrolase family protein [Acidipila rosea]MBW4043863.1 fumarylacetoacetate hydrolase family protein [Acidobacteriota bacterium]TCK74165.1 2-keto-4-pentenoate hydratase/2-oxohepta-3-ene-1,7-dioic acid hydratase in catechol pathway [Acidipila rosea]